MSYQSVQNPDWHQVLGKLTNINRICSSAPVGFCSRISQQTKTSEPMMVGDVRQHAYVGPQEAVSVTRHVRVMSPDFERHKARTFSIDQLGLPP